MALNIKSEIGKLKSVLVHCPGTEVENIVPDSLGRLLFDDIPYLKFAIEEHKEFQQALRDSGAEVLHVTELAKEVFADEQVRMAFVNDIIGESFVYSRQSYNALFDYFMELPVVEMVHAVVSGVRKCDVRYEIESLSDMVKDDSAFFLDPLPNMYFTRDTGAVTGNGLSLFRMKSIARRRETLFLKHIVPRHPKFRGAPLYSERTNVFNMEGGDVLVISNDTLFIGVGERTMPQAVESLGKTLFEQTELKRVIVFEIQKKRAFMHLDTVMTMLDRDKFIVHPCVSEVGLFELYKGKGGEAKARSIEDSVEKTIESAIGGPPTFIVCGGGDAIVAHREQWNDGANTLAVAPGVAITYDRNYVSNELLDKAGVKVITIPSSELARGRGGPRCMCMPLEREDL